MNNRALPILTRLLRLKMCISDPIFRSTPFVKLASKETAVSDCFSFNLASNVVTNGGLSRSGNQWPCTRPRTSGVHAISLLRGDFPDVAPSIIDLPIMITKLKDLYGETLPGLRIAMDTRIR